MALTVETHCNASLRLFVLDLYGIVYKSQIVSLLSISFYISLNYKTNDENLSIGNIIYEKQGGNIMRDVLIHKGLMGSVHFSAEDKVFHGKIEGIDNLATFEGLVA